MNSAPLSFLLSRSCEMTDVVIVGGGLSGTLAAILLGRRGLRVSLIDPHEVYPVDFRAEQLVGAQVEVLDRLGLRDVLIGNLVPAAGAVASRRGRTIGGVTAPHYGIRYETMVNRARQHLPSSVRFVKAQVADIQLTADHQQVLLADGSWIQARVVVVATGLGQRLLRQLDIGRTMVDAAHSLTFGFDLELASSPLLPTLVMVAYGERSAERIDYLTLFNIDNHIRCNMFTYGAYRDAWTQDFRRRPMEMLRQAMPRLEQMTGTIRAIGPIEVRVNDLVAASGCERDGVVLIGDAFQTSCPAAGTGIGRLLNDIDRLCNHHLPSWLATEGMEASKISQFYGDPIKRNCDAEALRVAKYRRELAVETSLRWKIHRSRLALQNRLRLLVTRKQTARVGAEMAWTGESLAPMPQGNPASATSHSA